MELSINNILYSAFFSIFITLLIIILVLKSSSIIFLVTISLLCLILVFLKKYILAYFILILPFTLNLEQFRVTESIYFYHITSLLLILYIGIKTTSGSFKIYKTNLKGLGAFYLIYILLSFYWSSSMFDSLNATAKLLSDILIFISFYQLLMNKESFKFIVFNIVIIIGIIQTFIAFIQMFLWTNYNSQFFSGVMIGRPNGFFTEPDFLGSYLSFVISILFPFITKKETNLYKVFFIISFLGLIISTNRAGYLTVIILGLYYFVFFYKNTLINKFKIIKNFVLVIIFSGVVTYFLSNSLFNLIIERFSLTNDGAMNHRMLALSITIKYWLNNPIFGYGVGTWGRIAGIHIFENLESGGGAFNFLLSILFELGILGFLNIILIIFLLIYIGIKKSHKSNAPFSQAGYLGFLALLIDGQFSNMYLMTFSWFLLAWILSIFNSKVYN